MPESPPLENTGEHKAMGATAPGQGIKGEMASDASQRKAYFEGGETEGQTNQAGDSISKGVTAAEESAGRAADKYKEDKEKRF